MTQALLYKEWLKTRKTFWVSLAAALLLAAYACLSIQRIVVGKGVEHVWLIMLLKDQTFIDILKYVPLAIGVALGVAQMAPEMSHKRLKLTLHLPYPTNRLILWMILLGIIELTLIWVVTAGAVAIYQSTILPHELVSRCCITSLPWYLAGYIAYLFTASVCLEGRWAMRVIIALVAMGIACVLFMQPAPEAYWGAMSALILLIIILLALPYRSVYRFKEGLQD